MVTSEKLVYGWGDNSYGQLGVGDQVNRPTPCLIEVLTGKSVAKLAAGKTFSSMYIAYICEYSWHIIQAMGFLCFLPTMG